MTESQILQAEVLTELDALLTPAIIKRIGNALNIPARIMEETENETIEFLFALNEWKDFSPVQFDTAVGNINKSIREVARKLEWLSCPTSRHSKPISEEKSVKTFVELLGNKMTSKRWKILAGSTTKVNIKGNVDAKEMIMHCVENNLITSELASFQTLLVAMKEDALAYQVQGYASVFKNLSPVEFHDQMKRELGNDEKEDHEDWVAKLKRFIKKQNKDVSVILDQKPEQIDTVYVPLTVVKMKPVEEKVGVESGISEIEFLRSMHQKVQHETVELVDFESIVFNCDPSKSELWSMIGSPGCGKSFLCKHFAYLYGTDSLTKFKYTLTIPCRSEEWHSLEEARHEAGKSVDDEFILTWLMISMSTGAQWSKSLSHHLMRSDGEELFIIIDGADEFIRNIPFKATLLCKLLRRRCLSQSTILLTSRPGAWSELMYAHGTTFSIDANFQVLGFSPENRDVYFENRIETADKLTEVHEMFHLHDEIQQLSLVPVNASLFCALFNESNSILSNTLSHLYTQLIIYIIRRQLSRIGLNEESKVLFLSDFHPSIRECINSIGLEANQGIFERELTSDKLISLKIDDKDYPSDRLGLMQAHMKVVRFGVRVKVWTFQHLTIQEFMAALSIFNNSWRNQCYIVRYFTTSTQYLAMYKMVIRFVCGLLREDAGCITPILTRHMLPKPMSFRDVPMIHQLSYDFGIVEVSDWKEFTQTYVQLTTLINETNSDTVSDHFESLKQYSPYPLYLYFRYTVSPNDWHCFLLSLKYIHEFQIIDIQSGYVTAAQFHSLLTRITLCHLRYLALVFVEEGFDTIHSYLIHLSSATLPQETRISIHLQSCNMSKCPPSQLLFAATDRFAGSLNLSQSDMSEVMLRNLTNQFSLLENLFYRPNPDDPHWSIIQQLALDHQVNGLYIQDDDDIVPVTPDFVSRLSSLTELSAFQRRGSYELIPSLLSLTSLTHLHLYSHEPIPSNDYLHNPLVQLIANNSNVLMGLRLDGLHRIGFDSWNSYFGCVSSCTNIIVLELTYTEFSSDDIDCWYRASSALKSLACLTLWAIPLQDTGMIVLCHSLSYHPAIRRLRIQDCELSSASCVPIMCLIQTLKFVRKLQLKESELSDPNPEQFKLLMDTAEQCSVKIELMT